MRCGRAVFVAASLLVFAAARSPAAATPFANVTAFVIANLQPIMGAPIPAGLSFVCDGVAAISCDTSLTASYSGAGRYNVNESVIRTIALRNTSAASIPLDTVGLFTDVTSYAHTSTGVGVDNSATQSASFASAVYLWFPGLVPGLLDQHFCSTGGSVVACPGFSGDDNAYTFPIAALAPGQSLTIRTGVQLMVAVDAPEPASVTVLGSVLLAGLVVRRRPA